MLIMCVPYVKWQKYDCFACLWLKFFLFKIAKFWKKCEVGKNSGNSQETACEIRDDGSKMCPQMFERVRQIHGNRGRSTMALPLRRANTVNCSVRREESAEMEIYLLKSLHRTCILGTKKSLQEEEFIEGETCGPAVQDWTYIDEKVKPRENIKGSSVLP